MHLLEEFEVYLAATYDIKRLGEPQYFLGIRIIRDRDAKTIAIVQDAYIEKIAARFNLENCKPTWSPMPTRDLPKYTGTASASDKLNFQVRVGSIGFATVMSRADTATAYSTLSKHLQNPSQDHIDAATQCLQYLYTTRFWGYIYRGDTPSTDFFMCFSDASFADDLDTRRSSEGFSFFLFDGLIDSRATQQKTVTTSSTEAELLALTAAAREMMWWMRFFELIQCNLNQGKATIYCDNKQTIRLMTSEAPKLQTRLRHVDIHRSWLREQVSLGKIDIQWIPTNSMPTDGMTKILPPQAHSHFVNLLRMVDLEPAIAALNKPIA
jgi:hypothetical protein